MDSAGNRGGEHSGAHRIPAAVHFNGIVTVNDAGRVLYDALAEETDRAGLKARLMAEYEVDEATAEADVAEFLQQMREIGALVEEADGQK